VGSIGGVDLNSLGYGVLVGLLSLLGVAYLISSKREQKFQNEASKEETIVKVQAKGEDDDAEPVSKAISDFDTELDSDNPQKPSGDAE
jgi:hypothetical protein